MLAPSEITIKTGVSSARLDAMDALPAGFPYGVGACATASATIGAPLNWGGLAERLCRSDGRASLFARHISGTVAGKRFRQDVFKFQGE